MMLWRALAVWHSPRFVSSTPDKCIPEHLHMATGRLLTHASPADTAHVRLDVVLSRSLLEFNSERYTVQ